MKIAERRAVNGSNSSYTYFGDGSWDLEACKALGVNFVLVGDKIKHNQAIKNYKKQKKAFMYIGL
jgi:hypothetical protein